MEDSKVPSYLDYYYWIINNVHFHPVIIILPLIAWR